MRRHADRGAHDSSASSSWLRWLVAAFGAVQVGLRGPRPGRRPDVRAARSAVALVIGLAIGNLAISSSVRRGHRRRAVPFDRRRRRSPWTPSSSSGSSGSSPSGPARPRVGRSATSSRWRARRVGAARRSDRRRPVPRRSRCVQEAARAQVAAGASQVCVPGRDGVRDRRRGRARSCRRSQRTAAEAADQAIAAVGGRPACGGRRRRRPPRPIERSPPSTPRCFADAQPERLAETLRATAEASRRRARLRRRSGCSPAATGIAGEDVFTVAGRARRPRLPARPSALAHVSSPVGGRGRRGRPSSSPRATSSAPMRVRGAVVGAVHERAEHGRPDARAGGRAADDRRSARGGPRGRPGSAPSRPRPSSASTELDAMKTDFVAITSHELRTPLAGIRGFVDMLLRRGGRPLAGRAARSTSASSRPRPSG